MSPGIDRANLPRSSLPRGEFQLADLPEHVPNYSGDLEEIGVTGDVPRSAHMALAIAITNVDRCMAFEDCKRDTLDALAQLWRALTPEYQTVAVEYSRSATSVDVDGEAPGPAVASRPVDGTVEGTEWVDVEHIIATVRKDGETFKETYKHVDTERVSVTDADEGLTETPPGAVALAEGRTPEEAEEVRRKREGDADQ